MALKHGERHVVVKGDSMLVVKQINREWKTKNAALRSPRAQAQELLALFETWRVEWIPRQENRRADELGRAQSAPGPVPALASHRRFGRNQHRSGASGRGIRDAVIMELVAIGTVESTLMDRAVAPKQGHEGAPDAWLVLDAKLADGLDGIHQGDAILVLTWLDRAERTVLRVHPRDDPANPERGVFSTRSADRPNPIGLHRVQVLVIDGRRVRVRNLEALNGTPILDIKPVLSAADQ